MVIQYASDLHIEFPENKNFLKSNPLKPIGDTLVLAGDIVPFSKLGQHHDFFDYLSDNFENTYWVPGNHEYYSANLADKSGTFHEKIKDNVSLLNNSRVKCGNVDLLFTTLWTKITPKNQWYVYNSMNDFRLINDQGDTLTVDHYNLLHKECMQFLKSAFLSKTIDKSIVVSHHVPTFMNYPNGYEDNVLNEAFGVELEGFIEQHQPDFWIYGHTHSNTSDFSIGKTSVITNQLGYIQNNEQGNFRGNKIIEL